MAKKIEYYEDFLKTLEIREDINRQKSRRKIVISSAVLIVYFLFVLIIFSQTNTFSFLSSRSKSEVEDLKERVYKTENQLTGILETISNSDKKDISYQYLDNRINSMEEKNSYLYDTILSNPDTAITPKILREEQNNLDEKIQDLKEQTGRTNSILTSILITVLLAIVGYIVKQIWGSFTSKKDVTKE